MRLVLFPGEWSVIAYRVDGVLNAVRKVGAVCCVNLVLDVHLHGWLHVGDSQ